MKRVNLRAILPEVSDDLMSRFDDYFHAHQTVWQLFYKYSKMALDSGRKKYSHWAIVQRIRWHHEIERTGKEDFKISNDYIGLYARLLMRSDADFSGFFNIKEMKRVRKIA